ncbi:Zn-dependent hydrolase [Sporosarcina sp. D27]|uniref:Zn-dependent hydrolase n=1 Tax=Sporosarcina sp. D27 TaxID=1382305 RepID=UPI000470E374|nr:Zn-dependent hydrolase [Sporosarcina sp. D27]
MKINSSRLWDMVHELAGFTIPGKPWTRRSFSPIYNEGRQWLMKEMKACGLEVKMDAAANVIGRLEGKNPALPPIIIGSHTDTVTDGGRFDGIAGVLAGLEVARTLHDHSFQLDRPLEIVDFTAEEPSEYGLSTVGSRAWSGNLSEEMLTYTNTEGQTLGEAIAFAGGKPDEIAACLKKQRDIYLYLELHIEQGPVLLHEQADLGIVTGIVGIQRYKIIVDGKPNHAGTTPMHLRNDALAAASQMILALEEVASRTYEESVVGTAGVIANYPNGSNVVPGKVEFLLEIRSTSEKAIDEVSESFIKKAQNIASQRAVHVAHEDISRSQAITIDKDIQSLLHKAGSKVTDRLLELPSGAGHDANQMSLLAPVGMLFIPCKDGRSHCPEEWADQQDLAKGAQTLLNTVLEVGKPSK